MNAPRTGGCQCGAVRYEINGEPVEVYICHCRECQAQSSSAFGISVIVRCSDFRIVDGAPAVWTRDATVCGTLDCNFCPACGARLWHGDLAKDGVISVKGGSLDAKPDLACAKHIWVSRKLAGVIIPDGVEQHDEEPED